MRIISQFRDYYDGVQGTGIDTSLVYSRESKVIAADSNDIPFLGELNVR